MHPERERTSTPPAHFNEAQAEQALWQEFRDHGTSLNNTLNEALRIHGGPALWIFQVCVLSVGFSSPPLVSPAFVPFLTQFLPLLVHR
jgi:hypothetical protein